MSGRPPTLCERLLQAAIGTEARAEGVLGDLFEEYIRMSRDTSPVRAHCWYAAQTLALSLRFAARRIVRRRRTRHGPEAPRQGDSLMRTLGIELRHAARALKQRPALASVVVITLALGLGANAAIFAMVDALVVRPYDFPDLERIVLVSEALKGNELDTRGTTSPANFLDWKAQSDAFERLAAFEWWDANLSGRDEPEALQGFYVSADFFPALGIQPVLGRAFVPAEERVGDHRRVVLSYGLWQRRFAADPGIVGERITLDGQPYEVVGVAPRNFDFPLGSQVWAPLAFDAQTAARRASRYLTVIGRLAPGRSLSDAKTSIAVVGDRLRTRYPDENRNRDVRVMTLSRGMMDQGLGPVLTLWQASALFVLLISCTNIAGLLLARGAERHRDIAVRLAMGAARGRIVRELLLESVMLGLIAVPAACAVAWVALRALLSGMPAKIARFLPGWSSIDVDGRLILVTTGLALGTAVIFGLAPALQAARPGLLDSLRDGGRGATSGGARQRLRRALVVAEITLALPLLVAASMAVSGINRFLNGPQGYTPDGVLTMDVALPEPKYPTAEHRRRFAESAVEQLRGVPGVDLAAVVNIRPALGSNAGRRIEIDGPPVADASNPPEVDYRTATPEYFDVLRIPLIGGRPFNDGDRAGTAPVAIVSDSMAKRFWPDRDPVGRRLRIGTGPWLTVVGVSGDVIHDWFARRFAPTLFVPFAQAPSGSLSLLVRASGDTDAVAAGARRALHRVDPDQPIVEMMTMRAALQERTLGLQYIAGIMTVFGGLALLLAVIGVYGVIAYFVTQRRHEIGVRMALGATRRDVVRLAVAQTGGLVAAGGLLGVALSFALGRLIEAGLVGSVALQPHVVAAISGVLALVALGAGYIPARRAAGVDPNVALRES